MLVAVDIGNTNTRLGVFKGAGLIFEARLPSDTDPANGRAGSLIDAMLADRRIEKNAISGVIVASVVTELDEPFARSVRDRLGLEAVFVDHTFDLGIEIDYRPPDAIGADRLVDAFAAVQRYGAPVIVCDVGTAATIDAVDAERRFRGGIIAPGPQTLADSLFARTSKLPRVDIRPPESVFGDSTENSIRAGVYFGYIGLVDGIIARMKNEMGPATRVVATGGAAKMIAEGSELIGRVDANLLLDGLRMIHERRRGSSGDQA